MPRAQVWIWQFSWNLPEGHPELGALRPVGVCFAHDHRSISAPRRVESVDSSTCLPDAGRTSAPGPGRRCRVQWARRQGGALSPLRACRLRLTLTLGNNLFL